jgi:RNA polymerase sigma-70 factor (ECF subfamily)
MLQSTDWNPAQYRNLLKLQVRLLRPDRRFDRRFDSSDLVQETLLRAVTNRDQCQGDTEAQRVKWLLEILHNVVVTEVRKGLAGKRDVRLEASVQDALLRSSACLEQYLVARGPAPEEEAGHHELLLRLAAALEQLPDDQRFAFIQYVLCGDSIKEVAAQMESRSPKAVAMLVARARRQLAEALSGFR